MRVRPDSLRFEAWYCLDVFGRCTGAGAHGEQILNDYLLRERLAASELSGRTLKVGWKE
jgi:hypothetical protein